MFNFEGGCYAKVIRLRPDTSPRSMRHSDVRNGARNVVLDPVTRAVDFDADTITRIPAPVTRFSRSPTTSPAAPVATPGMWCSSRLTPSA